MIRIILASCNEDRALQFCSSPLFQNGDRVFGGVCSDKLPGSKPIPYKIFGSTYYRGGSRRLNGYRHHEKLVMIVRQKPGSEKNGSTYVIQIELPIAPTKNELKNILDTLGASGISAVRVDFGEADPFLKYKLGSGLSLGEEELSLFPLSLLVEALDE